MAFKLDGVVPWGRNFNEYKKMFLLDEKDKNKKIAGFGDGPASFNSEATEQGFSVTSFDPIYQCSKSDLEKRIGEVCAVVMEQMRENYDNYVWKDIKNLDELEDLRMSAMNKFLSDYKKGKAEGRYIYHELPLKLPYGDDTFDIGLSSHFLLMYTDLGYDFHIKAISEMLRVCREIRIFPLLDLSSDKSDMTENVIDYFGNNYAVNILNTEYEFQKNGNKLLVISK